MQGDATISAVQMNVEVRAVGSSHPTRVHVNFSQQRTISWNNSMLSHVDIKAVGATKYSST